MQLNASNSTAYFDTLAISVRLQRTLDDVAIGEVHLFAYLSCLIFLYDRQLHIAALMKCPDVSTRWGYEFAVTRDGAPFSVDIDNALNYLLRGGHIKKHGDRLLVSELGIEEFELLQSFPSYKDRDTFLEAACSSVLTLPVGMVRHALSQEPELRASALVGAPTPLLDQRSPALPQLQEHFSALSQTVGVDIKDLMVPVIIWLTFLDRTA